jgi:hypothetical protein
LTQERQIEAVGEIFQRGARGELFENYQIKENATDGKSSTQKR